MTDRGARIRGATIAYERSGTGLDLIWGHGLSQTRANEAALGLIDWSRVAANVVRYDARGHGLSESTPDLTGYSWAELARDQLALADHLGINRYIAAGASMGCGTALHAAAQAPDRVQALVLAIPPTGWETRAGQAEQWTMVADVIETTGVEAVIAARAEMEPPDPFRGDDERLTLQNAATRAWDPQRLAHVMRGAATADLPTREQISTIEAPCLILAWTGDPTHPASTANELRALLPHADLHLASTRADLDGWSDLIANLIADVAVQE